MVAGADGRAGGAHPLLWVVLLVQAAALVMLAVGSRPEVRYGVDSGRLAEERLLVEIRDELAALRLANERGAVRLEAAGAGSASAAPAPSRPEPLAVPAVDPVLARLDAIAAALGTGLVPEPTLDGPRFPRGEARQDILVEAITLGFDDSGLLNDRYVGLSAGQVLRTLGAPSLTSTQGDGQQALWGYRVGEGPDRHELWLTLLDGWVTWARVSSR